MIEIIPAIIPKNIVELGQKLALVENYVEWVHVDVMDGIFVKEETLRDPKAFKAITTSAKIEVHLMIWQPEREIQEWIASGARRIIFHYEATDQRKELAEQIHRAGLDAGIAINPATPPEFVEAFALYFDTIQVMAVKPGLGGQAFLEDAIVKIKFLQQRFPYKPISVDGGENPEVALKVIQAGGDRLVVGSFLFKDGNIKRALENIKSAVSFYNKG